MKTLEKVSDFVGKYMAAIVIVVAALSLLFPGTFSVVKTAWVNTLLGIVMFGMGLTLKPEDFKVVFSRPNKAHPLFKGLISAALRHTERG